MTDLFVVELAIFDAVGAAGGATAAFAAGGGVRLVTQRLRAHQQREGSVSNKPVTTIRVTHADMRGWDSDANATVTHQG